MTIYSFELEDLLWQEINVVNLKKCYLIVEQAYKQFPKEDDCITSIVLEAMLESTSDYVHSNIIKFLIIHLKNLKKR